MGQRRALIVASSEYQDPKLKRLRAPGADARELERVLRDPAIGDYATTVLTNEPEWHLRRQVSSFFKEAAREDFLLLHFACHGLKDEDGRLYFAAADTQVSDLEATAVSAEFVGRAMFASRSAQIVLLLDCCYSGAFPKGFAPRADSSVPLKETLLPTSSGGGFNRAILTASDSTEYAWEGDELTGSGVPSVFTRAVVEGLESGDADIDRDGYVSVDDLHSYVSSRLRSVSTRQTPRQWSDVAGALYVAVNPRAAEQVALPSYLIEALKSPVPGVRAGTLEELKRLASGANAGLAAAARRELEDLARNDDSRAVANAAKEALKSVAAMGRGEKEGDEDEEDVRRGRKREAPVAKGLRRQPALGAAALLGGVLLVGAFFLPLFSPPLQGTNSAAGGPLLFVDLIGAFAVAFVCGLLLLANASKRPPLAAGLLLGAGLEQLAFQLGDILGIRQLTSGLEGPSVAPFVGFVGSAVLVGASILFLNSLRRAGPLPRATSGFPPSSKFAAGLGAVVVLAAGFISPGPFSYTGTPGYAFPLAIATVGVAALAFVPGLARSLRVAFASAILVYGGLEFVGFVFWGGSASHYQLPTGAGTWVRAAAGVLLVAAGVAVYLAERRRTPA